ncbi:uncharacterized protein LOC132934623 [Metopolophium dirhodum]|uniref:uncharacterized protein LOC132934623 n=1 Tax=Metopolophium dirhodum TaxID=44670 RepID=UPI00298F7249|nr:uncharacterized protein LOC132934623 [Metopolophium dirhodum]
MSLLKTKHERSTNFIDSELQLLVDLVANQKHILENKKTDAVTANLKNKTWEALSNKFNCKSLNGYRSPKCLKFKYDNLKKNVKIKLRDVKSKPCVTGGGPPIPLKALGQLSPMEEQLRSLNPLAFSGTVSAFDSDRIKDSNTSRHEMLVQDYEKTDSDVSD